MQVHLDVEDTPGLFQTQDRSAWLGPEQEQRDKAWPWQAHPSRRPQEANLNRNTWHGIPRSTRFCLVASLPDLTISGFTTEPAPEPKKVPTGIATRHKITARLQDQGPTSCRCTDSALCLATPAQRARSLQSSWLPMACEAALSTSDCATAAIVKLRSPCNCAVVRSRARGSWPTALRATWTR